MAGEIKTFVIQTGTCGTHRKRFTTLRLAASNDGSILVAGINGHVVMLDPIKLSEVWRMDSQPQGWDKVTTSVAVGRNTV